jgi:hypothetical protein
MIIEICRVNHSIIPTKFFCEMILTYLQKSVNLSTVGAIHELPLLPRMKNAITMTARI